MQCGDHSQFISVILGSTFNLMKEIANIAVNIKNQDQSWLYYWSVFQGG